MESPLRALNDECSVALLHFLCSKSRFVTRNLVAHRHLLASRLDPLKLLYARSLTGSIPCKCAEDSNSGWRVAKNRTGCDLDEQPLDFIPHELLGPNLYLRTLSSATASSCPVATSGGPSSRTSVTTVGCSKDWSKRSGGLVGTCGVSRSCPTTSTFSSVRPNPTFLGACSSSSPVTPTGTRSGIADRATSPKAASRPLWSRMRATSGRSADTFTSTRYGGSGPWPHIRLTGRGQAIPAMPGSETASAGWPMRQSTRRGRARWEVATPRRHIDGSSKRDWRPCRRIPFGRLLVAGCWAARSSSTGCALG